MLRHLLLRSCTPPSRAPTEAAALHVKYETVDGAVLAEAVDTVVMQLKDGEE